MTDTRFSPGDGTAYVTDDVIVLAAGAGVDTDLMARCADSDDWDALLAATADHDDVAVVRHAEAGEHGDGRLHIAASGEVRVVVETADGELSIGGEPSRTVHTVEHPLSVRLSLRGAPAGGAPTDPADAYRVDGGAVPAQSVGRRLAATATEVVDPFDALFGRTIIRSVEQAAVRDDDDASAEPLGLLVFSTGVRVILDRPIVLGRNPRRGADPGAAPSRLVRIASPGVSRRHAAIAIDRWRASIDDLGSSNGTSVTMPGGRRRRLQPGHPVDLMPGASVELGGAVSFSVEEIA